MKIYHNCEKQTTLMNSSTAKEFKTHLSNVTGEEILIIKYPLCRFESPHQNGEYGILK